MFASNSRLIAAASLLCLLSLLSAPAKAQITVGGDAGEVIPANPATWTSSATAYIGFNSGKTGTITVAGGTSLSVSTCYLGESSSSGAATITGVASSWTIGSMLYVGDGGVGTLSVTNGGTVTSWAAFLANSIGSSGAAIINGVGSNWNNTGPLMVGAGGDGTLRIEDGGRVTCSGADVGYSSRGTAVVTGLGSTWNSSDLTLGTHSTGSTLTVDSGGMVNAKALYASLGDVMGNGTINATGLISDVDLVFDNSHAASKTFSFGSGGTLNLNVDGTSGLGAGYRGTGTLRIADGVKIASTSGNLGYCAGSSGTATVTGPGSAWTISGDLSVGSGGTGTLNVDNGGTVTTRTLGAPLSDLKGNGTINAKGLICDMDLVFDATHGAAQILEFGTGGTLNLNQDATASLGVGYHGTGTLRIADGMKISSSNGYLGQYAGSNGSALVTGAGSSWNPSSLYVGYSGTGTLTVASGAKVSSSGGSVGQSSGSSGTVVVTGPGSAWTNYSLTLGYSSGATGMLRVENGGIVSNGTAYLGMFSGSTGAAIITGTGSTWTNTGTLYVGNYSATGTLSVESGGTVSSATAYVGNSRSASGMVTVTGTGSKWTNSGPLYVGDFAYYGSPAFGTLTVENGGTITTRSLYASASDLKGDGTINTKGLVADMDLIFDGTHGSSQALPFGTGGTLNLSLDGTGVLGAGYRGVGSLRIADGVKIMSSGGSLAQNPVASGSVIITGPGSTWTASGTVNVGNGTLRMANGGTLSSYYFCLGLLSGMKGTVTVTDLGSQWANSGPLYVGYGGTGTLHIANGGTVSSSPGYLGESTDSSGTATVTGSGAAWNNSGTLCVGDRGTGLLTVGNGGKVTTQSVSINAASAANLHVGGNGMLVVGNATTAGSVANSGKVNLYVDAFLTANTYSPITELKGRAISWTGTGSYKGYGGTWNSTAHTFTAAAAATAASGASSTLTTGERLLVTDPATGRRVGASFGAVDAGTTFSAVPLGGADLIGLPADQCLLGAWNFATNFAGDQALLSFDVGAGQSYDMSVWHFNGTSWAPFSAPDLTYGDDGIADFAVTSFVGGYALTAAAHAGDSNYDNAVNVVDLGVLAKYYDTAAGATWATGDFSGDGRVDVVDLGVLAKNYDWSGSWAGAVPEPCCMALLALGGLGMLRRKSGHAG